MALPELIEIVPLTKPVHAEITVPGSKSITNRALILAALGNGETTLLGALWSEDTQVMVEALRKLGFAVEVLEDKLEPCNRTIKIKGQCGRIPNAGTEKDPLQIFVGNAGTAARFLAPLVCLGQGVYRLHGVPRMHERPQAALLQALRGLGYKIDSPNNRLPVAIHGIGPHHGKCRVSIEESSQFASGLLMCAKVAGWEVEVDGENAEESPYVVMTNSLVRAFAHAEETFQIEPDTSSGSYFWAVNEIAPGGSWHRNMREKVNHIPDARRFSEFVENVEHARSEFTDVSVSSWPMSLKGRLQIDANFAPWIEHWQDNRVVSRNSDLGDSIMTAIVLSPLLSERTKYTDLGRLRLQECERVVALRTELTKCGAKVTEEGDTLEILPSQLHGAEIETYGDHRMAMCFAVLGLRVPGIKVRNPGCVKKTFPNFFQKLASPPPHGLGATILDPRNGRELALGDLFAD